MSNPGFTIWLTGLSGAGKSTISREIERRFSDMGRSVEIMDGDVIRTNLSKGFISTCQRGQEKRIHW